jgi:hypothetical protein
MVSPSDSKKSIVVVDIVVVGGIAHSHKLFRGQRNRKVVRRR